MWGRRLDSKRRKWEIAEQATNDKTLQATNWRKKGREQCSDTQKEKKAKWYSLALSLCVCACVCVCVRACVRESEHGTSVRVSPCARACAHDEERVERGEREREVEDQQHGEDARPVVTPNLGAHHDAQERDERHCHHVQDQRVPREGNEPE
eukprot:6201048-Pleurochrysis_carterae.AAC.1